MEGEGEVNLESDEVLPSDDDKVRSGKALTKRTLHSVFMGGKNTLTADTVISSVAVTQSV